MKLFLNRPRSPFFKGGMLSKGSIKPLFEKEGQWEIYSANFWATTLASEGAEAVTDGGG